MFVLIAHSANPFIFPAIGLSLVLFVVHANETLEASTTQNHRMLRDVVATSLLGHMHTSLSLKNINVHEWHKIRIRIDGLI